MNDEQIPGSHRSPVVREGEGWSTLETKVCYSDPHTTLALHRVRSPHHPHEREWTVVHRKAAAVVAPRTPEGRLVLVRQERIPVRRLMWEFPAGQIDAAAEFHQEQIQRTAARELEEESGYTLAEEGLWRPLGYFFTSVGFTDEHAWLFLADGVVPTGNGIAPDHSESIVEVAEFSVEQLGAMINAGEICDANTLALYARMRAGGWL